jgi:hypothetical protein
MPRTRKRANKRTRQQSEKLKQQEQPIEREKALDRKDGEDNRGRPIKVGSIVLDSCGAVGVVTAMDGDSYLMRMIADQDGNDFGGDTADWCRGSVLVTPRFSDLQKLSPRTPARPVGASALAARMLELLATLKSIKSELRAASKAAKSDKDLSKRLQDAADAIFGEGAGESYSPFLDVIGWHAIGERSDALSLAYASDANAEKAGAAR